jgi:hypothetical protein
MCLHECGASQWINLALAKAALLRRFELLVCELGFHIFERPAARERPIQVRRSSWFPSKPAPICAPVACGSRLPLSAHRAAAEFLIELYSVC